MGSNLSNDHSIRQSIMDAVTAVQPFDALEQEHLEDISAWVDSQAPIFRVRKPADPPKHLVSYFVLVDDEARSLMLVDHISAGLWLPAGGHVEVDEHPWTTVTREIVEELGVEAEPLPGFGNQPLFATVTKTRGSKPHTDVSLWYVVKGLSGRAYDYDPAEFRAYRWFGLDEVLDADAGGFDPHMHRSVRKLRAHSSDLRS
jgi:8-oxo-dGTP pyrophosphatase MutT (NUDIX family)